MPQSFALPQPLDDFDMWGSVSKIEVARGGEGRPAAIRQARGEDFLGMGPCMRDLLELQQ